MLGERLHALLVPQSGIDLDVASPRVWLEQRIERFKIPDRFYVHASLTLGATGKADSRALRDMLIASAAGVTGGGPVW